MEFGNANSTMKIEIIPYGTKQPRAEMCTTLHNAHTGKLARRLFSKYHKSTIKLTDSQIILYSIINEEHPKQSHREYLQSKNIIPDFGAQKG